jgi:DNA-binding MarR family transcriptional regulator
MAPWRTSSVSTCAARSSPSFRHFAHAVSAAEGITPGLYGMLQAIGNNPGLSQSALAVAMEVDRSSIVKVVDQLEQKGLDRP